MSNLTTDNKNIENYIENFIQENQHESIGLLSRFGDITIGELQYICQNFFNCLRKFDNEKILDEYLKISTESTKIELFEKIFKIYAFLSINNLGKKPYYGRYPRVPVDFRTGSEYDYDDDEDDLLVIPNEDNNFLLSSSDGKNMMRIMLRLKNIHVLSKLSEDFF